MEVKKLLDCVGICCAPSNEEITALRAKSLLKKAEPVLKFVDSSDKSVDSSDISVMCLRSYQ
jgi:hypothetical protein